MSIQSGDAKSDNYSLSQKMIVRTLKEQHVMFVTIDEFKKLKTRLGQINKSYWICITFGGMFMGISLSTFMAVLTGGIPANSSDHSYTTIAVVLAVLMLVVSLLLFETHRNGEQKREGIAVGVVDLLEIIEERFNESASDETKQSNAQPEQQHDLKTSVSPVAAPRAPSTAAPLAGARAYAKPDSARPQTSTAERFRLAVEKARRDRDGGGQK